MITPYQADTYEVGYSMEAVIDSELEVPNFPPYATQRTACILIS